MNHDIASYQAEIDYRREQMRRDREPLLRWRRARAAAVARRRGR